MAGAQSSSSTSDDFRFSDLSLEPLRQQVAAFAKERDWEQFHTPRNLLLAMVGEVGELSEIFQWRGEVAPGLPGWKDKDKVHLGEEMADVFIYLLRLADRCQIDISAAALDKLKKNAQKYPASKCRGSSEKYTAYAAAEGSAGSKKRGREDEDEAATGSAAAPPAAAAAAAAAAAPSDDDASKRQKSTKD